MKKRNARPRRAEPSGAPPFETRVRFLGGAVLVAWLVSELWAGGSLVRNNASALGYLRAQPRDSRQLLLLSRAVPIAGELERLGSQLPRDARVFLLRARLEEYYLANYLLHPRTVLVDEPAVAVTGVRGEAVGRALSAERLGGLGITHLVAVDSSHRSLSVSAIERE
jgi:hypothetical protein